MAWDKGMVADIPAPLDLSQESEFDSPDESIVRQSSETRPEIRLLVACARTEIDAETADAIRYLLKKAIDWAYLFKQANRHFVAPLLSFNLLTHFPDAIPEELRRSVRIGLQAHARHNLFMAQELIRLIAKLESNGIPVLPFKGPVLTALAYKNLSLRQFGDLDILVRKRDVTRARKQLMAEGYGAGTLTWFQKRIPTFSTRKDLVLVNASTNVRIELHWRLSGKYFSFPVEAKHFWNRLDVMNLAGTFVRTLPPQEVLLYLCMHGSRHSWERLGWICDVAEMVRANSSWNWSEVMREASELGNERNLALGLYLANDLLGARIHPAVLDKVRSDPMIRSLAAQVQALLFQDVQPSLDIGYLHDYHLKVKERMTDRVRLRWHYYRRYLQLVLRPTAQDRTGLSNRAHLSFLRYVTRPFRLIGLYGAGLLARAFHQIRKL